MPGTGIYDRFRRHCATQGRELFYQKLLQGQYLFHQTCGATLALNVELTFVTLQIVKDMQTLTVQNFPILVANFLRTAEYWHARCEEASDLPGTEKQGGTAENENCAYLFSANAIRA